MSPRTILFVCSGNICRSPLAEAVARRALTDHFQVADLHAVGLQVTSAGTHAQVGQPATGEMQTVAEEIGLDLSGHRARQIQTNALESASAVYAMELHHLDRLVSRSTGAPVRLLSENEIRDPYGSNDIAEYRRASRIIAQAVRDRLSEMIALAD